jgi:putative glutathione S-transferase
MLNSAFDTFADAAVDLYPQELRPAIDALNERIYDGLNNGVYRAGLPQRKKHTRKRSAACLLS